MLLLNRRRLRLLIVALVYAAFGSIGGCYYLHSEPVPEVSEYDLDLEGLRRMAATIPGPLPIEVRYEKVATSELPGAMMMAGKNWDAVEMVRVVFQVLQPNGDYALIDTAESREMHESLPGDHPYDDAAWRRVMEVMEGATHIIVTHEHPDHLGGVARHPNPDAIAPRVRLTQEQLDNQKELEAIDFSADLAAKIEGLIYEDALALAPGIVLKKAAGHTPGSQMVYVKLAYGTELLFVGDVVWNLDALTELRYRPRFMTDWIIGEDREAGLHQLRALRDLLDTEDVQIVIAHDERTLQHPAIEAGFQMMKR